MPIDRGKLANSPGLLPHFSRGLRMRFDGVNQAQVYGRNRICTDLI